jgi:DNA-binding NarL/FixJ family response regulator
MWQHCGIRVFIIERDVYARQAVASYFSWDRRTHVVGMGASLCEMIAALNIEAEGLRLDVVTLNTDALTSPAELISTIGLIQQRVHSAHVICLSTRTDLEWMKAARQAGACAYMTREIIDMGVASAVWYAISHDFTVTEDIAHQIEVQACPEACGISVLPGRRHYDRLTPRIQQALWLCVVEGLPADLAAEEMGVSVSTVRSYIKEGYRILESEDETPYPMSVSPAERAFLRFTALEEPELPLHSA